MPEACFASGSRAAGAQSRSVSMQSREHGQLMAHMKRVFLNGGLFSPNNVLSVRGKMQTCLQTADSRRLEPWARAETICLLLGCLYTTDYIFHFKLR